MDIASKKIALEQGKKAENWVAEQVQAWGWKILAKNYRLKAGELDLVAQEKTALVFIEVRSCKLGALLHPLETITYPKQKRLGFAARHYMARLSDKSRFEEIRFDLACVFYGEKVHLEYYRGVFFPGEWIFF